MALRVARPRDAALLLFVPAGIAEAGPMWFDDRRLPMVYGVAVAQAVVRIALPSDDRYAGRMLDYPEAAPDVAACRRRVQDRPARRM